MTPLMASVAQRHAVEISRMVVLKELYLLENGDRKLLRGVDVRRSPAAEIGGVASVRGVWDDPQTVAVSGSARRGTKTVTLAFLNGHWDGERRQGRHLWVDRLDLFDAAGNLAGTVEIEELADYAEGHLGDCGHFTEDGYQFHGCEGAILRFPLEIAADGDYRMEIVLWGEQLDDELPRLSVSLDADAISARAARRIKARLAALHWDLLGTRVSADSADVDEAYEMFAEVWAQRRADGDARLCDWPAGLCLLHVDQGFFEGIVEEQPLGENDEGWRWVDWERAQKIIGGTPDPYHVAQSWAVVLAFLMTDYRYLHL